MPESEFGQRSARTGGALAEMDIATLNSVLSDGDLVSQADITSQINGAISGGTTIKGGYNASTNSPDLDTSPSGILIGDMYVVTVDGTFFTEAVETGDSLVALQDNPTTLAHWIRINKNIPALNLQNAYDASSVNPEILTNAVNGALTLRSYDGGDASNVLEVQTFDGTNTFAVTGEGNLICNNITATTSITLKEESGDDVLVISVLSTGAVNFDLRTGTGNTKAFDFYTEDNSYGMLLRDSLGVTGDFLNTFVVGGAIAEARFCVNNTGATCVLALYEDLSATFSSDLKVIGSMHCDKYKFADGVGGKMKLTSTELELYGGATGSDLGLAVDVNGDTTIANNLTVNGNTFLSVTGGIVTIQPQLTGVGTLEGGNLAFAGGFKSVSGQYDTVTFDSYQDNMRLFTVGDDDKTLQLLSTGAGNFNMTMDGDLTVSGEGGVTIIGDFGQSIAITVDSSGRGVFDLTQGVHTGNKHFDFKAKGTTGYGYLFRESDGSGVSAFLNIGVFEGAGNDSVTFNVSSNDTDPVLTIFEDYSAVFAGDLTVSGDFQFGTNDSHIRNSAGFSRIAFYTGGVVLNNDHEVMNYSLRDSNGNSAYFFSGANKDHTWIGDAVFTNNFACNGGTPQGKLDASTLANIEILLQAYGMAI